MLLLVVQGLSKLNILHVHACARIHACMHTHAHADVSAYVHARMSMCARAHTHTHTHTHKMHTCTQLFPAIMNTHALTMNLFLNTNIEYIFISYTHVHKPSLPCTISNLSITQNMSSICHLHSSKQTKKQTNKQQNQQLVLFL